jgi:thioredoxin 1
VNVLQLAQEDFHAAVMSAPWLVIELSEDLAGFAARAAQVAASDVVWGHVDTHTESALAATFWIETGPALLIFREQVILYLEHGAHAPGRIGELLERAAALDMQQVKAEIEAQKQAEVALRMRRVCPATRRGPGPG